MEPPKIKSIKASNEFYTPLIIVVVSSIQLHNCRATENQRVLQIDLFWHILPPYV